MRTAFNFELNNNLYMLAELPVVDEQRRRLRVTYNQFDCNNIVFPQVEGHAVVSWRVASVVCYRPSGKNTGHYWAYRRAPNTEKGFVKVNDTQIDVVTTTYNMFLDIPEAKCLVLQRN